MSSLTLSRRLWCARWITTTVTGTHSHGRSSGRLLPRWVVVPPSSSSPWSRIASRAWSSKGTDNEDNKKERPVGQEKAKKPTPSQSTSETQARKTYSKDHTKGPGVEANLDRLEDMIRSELTRTGQAEKQAIDWDMDDDDKEEDDDDEKAKNDNRKPWVKPKKPKPKKKMKFSLSDYADDQDDILEDDDTLDYDRFQELLKMQEAEGNIPPQEMTPEEAETKRQEREDAFSQKTGRGWTDPYDFLQYMWREPPPLRPWDPKYVSKLSQERVQIRGLATLQELARLPLPPPPHPHPAHDPERGSFKHYAAYRNLQLKAQVYEKVVALAAPRVKAIQELPTWEDKQDAVDELFERIEVTLKAKEEILGKHPRFGTWVEEGLEKYLQSLQSDTEEAPDTSAENAQGLPDKKSETKEEASEKTESSAPTKFPTREDDEKALPLFLDLYVEGVDAENRLVPHIVYPMMELTRGANRGRMLEEWDLAALKTSKRILLRQHMRTAAQFMENHDSSRIFVTGRWGAGKTATLLTLVAAARMSGHIVMFMPHVSMWAEYFFYVVPSEERPGIYDAPVVSRHILEYLMDYDKDVLGTIPIPPESMATFFSPRSIAKFKLMEKSWTVADIAQLAQDSLSVSAGCLSIAIDTLMKQDIRPFTMVLDEFNTLYQEPGHYYHAHYDKTTKKSIPYNQINIFQPALDAMGLVSDDRAILPEVLPIKRGHVIAAMSGSKPVARKINQALVNSGKDLAAQPNSNFLHVEVPRYSKLEVDHVMANYETIGLGKLRLDDGETVSNEQEVAYLRILSSNYPQELMDACIL